jgi:DNA-binding NarL/FixJ family response regulator
MPIRLLIFEDSQTLRESLIQMLELEVDLQVVGHFPHTQFAEEKIDSLQADIVLMDVDMPGRNGIETVRQIRRQNKHVQIIMLTVFDDSPNVFEALCAGANGYLLKKHASEKLVESIHEVKEGGAPMSPAIARMIINSLQKKQPQTYQLTNREQDILTSLSLGNSFKMIAASMSTSIDTVKTHTKRIYEKMQVNSQIEAVTKALREGLV